MFKAWDMIKLPIKALSVNKAWQGRRFKTKEYKAYEKDMSLLLPKLTIPSGNLTLEVCFGYSSKLSDIDNGLKQFIDCLQKKYDFNDNRIKRLLVSVDNDVKKGDEYIKFNLISLNTLHVIK
jgi:Holliday junction resolvase RusA-like endonuclease